MTQNEQEYLNEIFLGKEDPDLAFRVREDANLAFDIIKLNINPPVLVTAEVGGIIKMLDSPLDVVEFKIDNRYRDGNLKKVNGVYRGNRNTLATEWKETL